MGDLRYHPGAVSAGFLCSYFLGSEGVLSFASQVMGPPCWQGSRPAPLGLSQRKV